MPAILGGALAPTATLLYIDRQPRAFIRVKDGKRFNILNIKLDPQTMHFCIAAGVEPGA